MPDIAFRMSRDEAEQCLDEIRLGTLNIKAKLIELYEGRGWESLGYPSWRECIQAELRIGKSQAYRLLDAAYVLQEISPIGENVSESQARELAKAPQGKRAETLEKAKESAKSQGREKPTAKDIREAVDSGCGTKPPHNATQQDAERARRPVMDGDDGPCPKGGEHDLFTIQGQRACGKCRTVFPADDYDDDQPSELEGSNDPIIADTSVDFDFAGMRDTCRWWLDNCPRECLVMLAAEFELWTNKAKELL